MRLVEESFWDTPAALPTIAYAATSLAWSNQLLEGSVRRSVARASAAALIAAGVFTPLAVLVAGLSMFILGIPLGLLFGKDAMFSAAAFPLGIILGMAVGHMRAAPLPPSGWWTKILKYADVIGFSLGAMSAGWLMPNASTKWLGWIDGFI